MPALDQLAKSISAPDVEIQTGHLPDALAQADVAISKTGTVTMECAFFGVPTVTLYKTSWLTYQIARRIVTVKSLTMPNLLADEAIYPEFVQDAATPENIAGAALDLLQNESRRRNIKSQLARIIASLGGPGAPKRAAEAILSLFKLPSLILILLVILDFRSRRSRRMRWIQLLCKTSPARRGSK